MSNMKDLQYEVDRVVSLINDASTVMQEPVSNIRESFEISMSEISRPLSVQFAKAVSRGRIDHIIVGGALVGAAYLGAWAIDKARNAAAYIKTQKRLVGYYQELAVKQNLLVEAQQEIIQKMREDVSSLKDDQSELMAKYDQITGVLQRIKAAQQARTV